MGKPGKGGKSELDVLTDKVATELVGAFDLAKGAATGLWDAVKGIASGLKWINENVVSLEKVGKALVGIYAANKLLRLGGRAIGGTYRMVSAPVRGYRWLRNRRKENPVWGCHAVRYGRIRRAAGVCHQLADGRSRRWFWC